MTNLQFAVVLSALRPPPSALVFPLLLLALAIAPVTAHAGLREAAQKVDQGIATFHSGDYKTAAAAFEEAEQAQPDDERITFDRACALAAEGEGDQATELFQKATLARDKPLVASSHYNLGCIALDKAKALFGAHPEEAAPDARKDGVELVARAVGHFRDCLGVDPNHADARYNLESIRLWLKHIEAVWKDRDRQRRRNEMNLLEFLQMLEAEQRTMRSVTPVLAALPASPKQRQAVREAQAAQRSLGEEIEPLKGKIQSALTASAQAPGNTAAAPSASGVPGQAQPPDANTQKAIDLLTGLAEEIGLAMERAANRLGDQALASVTKEQTAAVEKLDEIFMAVAPYVNLVQKAIAAEQGLVDQLAADNDSPLPQGQGGADNSPRPRGEGQGVRDQTKTPAKQKEKKEKKEKQEKESSQQKATNQSPQADAAWNQRFVTRYSQILPAKARRELEQLGAETEGQQADGGGRRPEDSDGGGVGKLKALGPSEEENKKEDGTKQKEEEQPEPPQTEGEQNQQELQKQELKRALKKGIELAPLVETLSTGAAKLLDAGIVPDAVPKQKEAIRLLEEMLPKQQQQQQQDEKKEKQDEKNKDQKDQKEQQKEQPKDQQKDQQKEKSKDQQKDQQQKQPKEQQQQRDLSKQQAEAVLRRIHQRQQERQELEKQLQQYLYRPDKVEKDW